MEKSSKKRKIEITRGIGFQEIELENGKKTIKPGFGKNVDRVSIDLGNSEEYGPKKAYLKDLQVEIIGIKGHDEGFFDFIKNI